MVKFISAAVLLVCSSHSFAAQDPTAPLNWQKPTVPQETKKVVNRPLPKLESIVCSGDVACKAVVSGQVVVAGDSISGYQVKNVESEHVVLSRGGKQLNLKLFALDIKQ
ncbi:MSHA biogenesis protein MshK [Vibrio japonicus]|uniref:MSHA biogenesis protein MshK n=1 Tax=Vibrio japonicus TaxID=1824638 RepID=A0ABY5LJ24_9VIBR|nr:MSHA biogenesis protein MshK [Vibrio japonicus]UUM30904.1 MSHA biogenesis protein MshK [Vibrio japonicus]